MARRTYKSAPLLTKAQMIEKVIEPIIEAMESGKLLWLRPWNAGAGGMSHNPLREEGKAKGFNGGINNILLMIASLTNGWSDPRWAGRSQIKAAGYSIKGLTNLKSTTIYRPVMRKTGKKNAEGKDEMFCVGFRVARVFNFEQIDQEGEVKKIPSLNPEPTENINIKTGYERALAIRTAFGVEVNHGGGKAFYLPAHDRIQMPDISAFKGAAEYWSTMLHEMLHATGHPSRLDRNLKNSFGSAEYAFEELVAEIGAAFMCAHLGIEKEEVTRNHAAYLQSWSRKLKEKPEAFVDATNLAFKAFAYLRDMEG